MSINIRQDGREIVARLPKMAELNPVLDAPKSPLAYKTVAKACCLTPTLGELSKEKPACGPALGMVIVGASGLFAAVVEVDPEVEDLPADVAAAYLAMEQKGARGLVVLRTVVGGITRHFVQTMPTETNVDAYLRTETLEAAKTLCEPITAFPAKDGFEALQHEAPGLYHVLAKSALERAGLVDEVTLGEA